MEGRVTATWTAVERTEGPARAGRGGSRSALTVGVALVGFFVITLDAVVVNVALPTIGRDLGGGITGLQWIVDGYTLMFAALLLTSGSLSDRIGARLAFGAGMGVFLAASLACGLAPMLTVLVAARFVQGAGAALMMPSSMALIRQAHADPVRRAHAVAIWAMGASVAATSGPVLGGVLTGVSWRLIFLINLPVGLLALMALRRVGASTSRPVPIDWIGQITAVLAMGGLTYGAIEAGKTGLESDRVLVAFGLAIAGLVAFLITQARRRHPMVPLPLFRRRPVSVSVIIGFAFMMGYFGMPFVFSLYFQAHRGLTALQTGILFLPMMLIGLILTPFSARIVERTGHRLPMIGGLTAMSIGLVVLGLMPNTTPLVVLAALMVLVGLGGPLVMPPTIAVLLNGVDGHTAGTASGVFNTSRQLGGALGIAVFGALLANGSNFMHGLRDSLLIAGAATAVAAASALWLHLGLPTIKEHRAQLVQVHHG